jgi:hypothetical protein
MAQMKLTFGTYNFAFGGFDEGSPARLRRQLQMLNSVQAHAWAFQECSNWRDDRTQTLGMVEAALGMRGFIARSNRGPGGDVAVFIRESAGIRLVEQRHEEQPVPYWHAVAHIVCKLDGFGLIRFASAHLAPSAPAIRRGEAESFQPAQAKRPPESVAGIRAGQDPYRTATDQPGRAKRPLRLPLDPPQPERVERPVRSHPVLGKPVA